jgi:uncharacterized protein
MSRFGRDLPSLAGGMIMAGGIALALGMLAGCTATPLPEGESSIDFGSSLAFRLPVESLVGRRFDTVVRQQYDFSCGSAALATLLRYHYEDQQSEQTVFLGMWDRGDREQIRKLGFSLLDMKRYLASRGISADGYQVTLDQVRTAATPGIALIDFEGYRHFVVIKGFDGKALLLGDPSLGLRREDVRAFSKQWNGVYFVINGRRAIAKSHFSQASDLARAPAHPAFSDIVPLDISGLARTRPLPTENPFFY